ncbi:MAG: hypothetical protein BRD50_09435, partial [Bacteroidetes bacterium SW_11_45_7]
PDTLSTTIASCNDSAIIPFTIYNNGSDTLLWNTDTLFAGNNFVSPIAPTSSDSGIVEAGDSAVVDVLFTSKGLVNGNYANGLTVSSNDPVTPMDTVRTFLQVNGDPVISLSDTVLDFGSVLVGDVVQDSFQLLNHGCDTLAVSNLSVLDTSLFSVNAASQTILPFDSTEITVTYSPDSVGDNNDALSIATNVGDTTVILKADGVPAPVITTNPDTLDVTITGCKDSTQVPLTILNNGNDTLHWDASSTDFSDNFDPGIDNSQWDNIAGASASGNCGSYSGSHALYFGGSGQRMAVSKDLNTVNNRGTLTFYLKIATSGSPCENADAGEGISLQYSTDGGSSWTNLNYYNTDDFASFTNVAEDLPPAARTNATRFRWVQSSFNGGSYDHWAIDNVELDAKSAFIPDTGSVAVGDSTQVNVKFFAEEWVTGSQIKQLLINSNDPVTPQYNVTAQVTVNGDPVLSLSNDSLDMGTVNSGASKTDSLLIRNTGCDTLQVTNATTTLALQPSHMKILLNS